MKNNLFKKLIKLYYKKNSTHHIIFGPMAGMQFRVNAVTPLATLYSGDERSHQKRFKKMLKDNSVMIDIGANWGTHTLYASKLVGSTGKIIVIEPFPPAFEELKWHIAKNKCRNVTVLNVAIGKIDGEVRMLSRTTLDQGVVADFVSRPEDLVNEFLAKQQKLDTVVQELALERVDLIKIDVEGAENNVLQGAEQTVNRFRPVFIMDLHSPDNDLFAAEWFTKKGYTLQRVNENLPPILKTDKGWPEKNGVWGSVLAIPRIQEKIA